MSMRVLVANVFYGIVLVLSLGNLIAIIAIHWRFLIEGKGVGSFTVPWFICYFLATFVMWGIAFFLEKNWVLSAIYWVTILVPVLIFMFMPVKFYID